MRRHAVCLAIALVVAGTSRAQAATGKAVIAPTHKGSTLSGTAMFSEGPSGVQMAVRVQGAPPGQHGIHIHEHGACEDEGKTAGGHFNPDNTPHGFLPTNGPTKAHAGDTGNLIVNADGTGTLQLFVPGLTLATGPHAIAGKAVILHANPDDFSQPAGNAGARIGCGVIEVTQP